ncbi:FmdB family zinc ribbon protein [Desulfobacula phenolica]|uniref:Putative regulatory protein, FmdB family n=1 Tax=Desulfobacula phenolica TaxID=90732 RepID=A0A1H2DP33_9BACT|nr:FmdB family zinc ribbon protein [Desulfobacula phenolica]SDT84491.1 putative regulatory protein, FmdB family [Desulfobacula phenolica]
MPVYEYQCTECGQIEEALQKISDSPLTTCPHCKGSLKKLISQSSFHLKGSGWYVTDYGGAKTGTETKSDKKAGTKSKESKTTSKTTSKKTIDSKN